MGHPYGTQKIKISQILRLKPGATKWTIPKGIISGWKKPSMGFNPLEGFQKIKPNNHPMILPIRGQPFPLENYSH